MAFDFTELEKNLADEFKELKEDEVEEETLEEDSEDEDEVEEEILEEGDSDEDEVEVEEEETEDEILEDDIISEDDLKDIEEKQIVARKPTPEEKRNYAFEKLRKENKERKVKEEELDRIAKSYGYKDNDEMIAALKEDALKKEATKKGVDPELYKKVYDTEKELERMRTEREQEQRAMKVTNFVAKLDDFVIKNGLSESDKEELLIAMESDGYTIDDVVNIKNPVNLFRGYSVDKIKERAKQDEIAKLEKKRRAAEKKFTPTPDTNTEDDFDELLKAYFSKKQT